MDRRIFLKVIGVSGISIGLSGLMGCGQKFGFTQKQRNVLFIAVDDLRPELGCYSKQLNTKWASGVSHLFEKKLRTGQWRGSYTVVEILRVLCDNAGSHSISVHLRRPEQI